MIILRDYKASDSDRLVKLANNKNVSRFLIYTFPFPYLKNDADWWIEFGCRENGAITKVIEYMGEFVGSVGISPQTGWRSHIAEIGYWIGESFWGKGIATEAVKMMTDISFSQLNFRKLFASVHAPNKASIRLLEKAGYELEATLRQENFKDGEYRDVHQYARLNTKLV
jgi:[ribosomal protein S5]-alanine N-acetyltransferase